MGNWFCEECDAHFEWLIWEEIDEIDMQLRRPITDKDMEEAELFTDFGMSHGEFYAVGEDGIELNQEPCSECMKKICSEKAGTSHR